MRRSIANIIVNKEKLKAFHYNWEVPKERGGILYLVVLKVSAKTVRKEKKVKEI